ncbi:MAG TPA: ABC transporter ATP-binding protein [Armatimonadota bacterium]|nr:ABC transporter ATP-binding protein [Armatimonadota bacterium]
MQDILQVEKLCKDYGDFRLDHVSFSLPAGSIMGFIGENGAGKTTTIKLILNMIAKDGGNVNVFGLDHIRQEEMIKQDTGVVLDELHFPEGLRPSDIPGILRPIFHHWDDALYTKYLTRFSIPADKTVKQLSKGMKTKLSLCTALAHHPRLLILDEATSGLDPVMRAEILDIFQDIIQDEERAILMSTHIISDLEKVADYITLIDAGRIVFSESADRLKYGYGILRCGESGLLRLPPEDIAGRRKSAFSCEALVKDPERLRRRFPDLVIDAASIEDIMMFFVRSSEQ